MNATLFLHILSQKLTTPLFPIFVYRGESLWNAGLWIQNMQGKRQGPHWCASTRLLLMAPEKQWLLVQDKKKAIEDALEKPFVAEAWRFCPWLESHTIQEEKHGGFQVTYQYRFFGSSSATAVLQEA